MRALQEHQDRDHRRKSSQVQSEEDPLELDAGVVEPELEEECPLLSEWPLSVVLALPLVTALLLVMVLVAAHLVLAVEVVEQVEEEEFPLLLEWLPSRNPLEHQLEFLRTTRLLHLLHHLLPLLPLLLLEEGPDLERPLQWPP